MPNNKKPEVKELRKTGKGQKIDRAIPGNAGEKVATPASAPVDKKAAKNRKAHAMPPIVVRNHACRPHGYQDRVYGDQVRLQNACVDKAKGLAHRCTVCGVVT